MFQSIRPNSPIYVFYKGDSPRIAVGQVVNQSAVRPKYTVPTAYGQPQDLIIDFSIKLGEQVCKFTNIPANVDIADAFCDGESVIISASKDAMNAEILNMKQKSIDVINSIDYHKSFISKCDKLLMDLNPDFAEKQSQKEEIASLKKSVEELIESNRKLMEQLSQKQVNYENVGN